MYFGLYNFICNNIRGHIVTFSGAASSRSPRAHASQPATHRQKKTLKSCDNTSAQFAVTKDSNNNKWKIIRDLQFCLDAMAEAPVAVQLPPEWAPEGQLLAAPGVIVDYALLAVLPGAEAASQDSGHKEGLKRLAQPSAPNRLQRRQAKVDVVTDDAGLRAPPNSLDQQVRLPGRVTQEGPWIANGIITPAVLRQHHQPKHRRDSEQEPAEHLVNGSGHRYDRCTLTGHQHLVHRAHHRRPQIRNRC